MASAGLRAPETAGQYIDAHRAAVMRIVFARARNASARHRAGAAAAAEKPQYLGLSRALNPYLVGNAGRVASRPFDFGQYPAGPLA